MFESYDDDNPPRWRHTCGCDHTCGGSREALMNLRWSWHWLFCSKAREDTRRFWGQY